MAVTADSGAAGQQQMLLEPKFAASNIFSISVIHGRLVRNDNEDLFMEGDAKGIERGIGETGNLYHPHTIPIPYLSPLTLTIYNLIEREVDVGFPINISFPLDPPSTS